MLQNHITSYSFERHICGYVTVIAIFKNKPLSFEFIKCCSNRTHNFKNLKILQVIEVA